MKPASEVDIADQRRFSDVKEVPVTLASGKEVKLYLNPLGYADDHESSRKSNAIIYYQPGLNELEVAEAIGSLEFAQAWQDHHTATGTGYNVESGFDVVENF